MGMESRKYRLIGTAPLLMSSDRLVNPLDPIAREIKKITRKSAKSKTEDDYKHLSDLKFEAGLYLDDKLGPYIPAQNIDALVVEAARMRRLGKTIEKAFMTLEDRTPLQYDGPRDLKGLLADPQFRDERSVKVGQSRIMHTRPIFRVWALDFEAVFETDMLDPQTADDLLVLGGRYVGLGNFRPRFGRYRVEILNG